MPQPEPTVVARILDIFRRAYQEADDILNEIDDPDRAFQTVTDLDKQLRALHNERTTRQKARQAVRIKAAHALSLGKLGKRLNRSKALAARYVEIDKAAAQEDKPCSS
jgi:predicted nucleotide-binding protein